MTKVRLKTAWAVIANAPGHIYASIAQEVERILGNAVTQCGSVSGSGVKRGVIGFLKNAVMCSTV